ncbi:MAG TPA: 2-hydroxyacyl-CoA dehydratase, partial [Firmicutes bacterium]|nr:2-hydroxyacyl-CoA dehydratase [Bacillota bacterium]
PNIVSEGLQNVHNDTCYPCLLVVGQFIDALKSGKYDPNKTALIITQTGGGCRASNYIHLLRKALHKAGFDQVPVISLNLSGLEHNSGFKLSLGLLLKLISALLYGDMLMLLANQIRPYETQPGAADQNVTKWIGILAGYYKKSSGFSMKEMEKTFRAMIEDFAKIPFVRTPKIKVGIVGEIYVKYSPLANNNLEQFLFREGAEVIVPGLLDFILFKFDNRLVDIDLYGGNPVKYKVVGLLKNYMLRAQKVYIQTLKESGVFDAPADFETIKKMVKPFIGYGAKMGEGWLLTAEMVELVHSGVENVVCAQPFGCLPNHIVGKGMIRKIRNEMPHANIVAIDYDPGATKVNQENRLKLMLATAKDRMQEQEREQKKTRLQVRVKEEKEPIAVHE